MIFGEDLGSLLSSGIYSYHEITPIFGVGSLNEIWVLPNSNYIVAHNNGPIPQNNKSHI